VTTAAEIMAEAARRGVVLRIEGGRLKWSAPTGAMTADLAGTITANKAEIIAALGVAATGSEQRHGCAPVEELPLALVRPTVTDRDGELLVEFFTRQPVAVVQWILAQADRYGTAAPHWQPPALREYAAALDALLWQWEGTLPAEDEASQGQRVKAALEKLRGLGAAAREILHGGEQA
jgi:hypothetical protein